MTEPPLIITVPIIWSPGMQLVILSWVVFLLYQVYCWAVGIVPGS